MKVDSSRGNDFGGDFRGGFTQKEHLPFCKEFIILWDKDRVVFDHAV